MTDASRRASNRPRPFGLYRPDTERDACGLGFVAHIRGEKSRAIVEQGLEILQRLEHRGACGCDPETGDGAGILVQLPHRFFVQEAQRLGWETPVKQRYGVGMVFLPPDPEQRKQCEAIFEQVVVDEGQRVIGWRDVPVDPDQVGRIAREALPVIRQIWIARRRLVPSAFERKLYVIRKLTENRIRERGADPGRFFHVASLSGDTIVYKGLFLPRQLPAFYADLRDPAFVSAIALVHSRFSTNTFPTWDLAQPFRHICHNGEINTVKGNQNWMNARRSMLQSAKFGGNMTRLFPVISPDGSDSLCFDNVLELLHLGGRTLPHAMMMMIPEAWDGNTAIDEERRAFYDYSATLMEPWDGPAAIAFTDGHVVGATLDRNGLRPARYIVTRDDRVILASETGVLDIAPEDILEKGRLRPGRMFLVDTEEGRIITDEEIKRDITTRWPYRRWLDKNEFDLSELPAVPPMPPTPASEIRRLQRAFGYTDEDLRLILEPMATDGKEPTGSMGTDTPLAVLSDQAPSLFNYFRQLFAQVTNPPIDPIRESLVMSLRTSIGQGGNTFDETPEQCHRLTIEGPVLTNHDLARIVGIKEGAFEATRLPIHWDPRYETLEQAVDRITRSASDAIDEGYNVLVLTDRGVDARRVAIPALLAVSAVHQHLVRLGIRTQAGLVIETAEAREVHHFALLVGYGAAAVNPWLALDTLRDLAASGSLPVTAEKAEENYVHAIFEGLLKVMSKMGISTIQSYRGAMIFEAIGLASDLVQKHFTGTASRIEGMGMQEIGREALERHARAWGPHIGIAGDELPAGGQYQWRRRGELHKWNPGTIARLQTAVRNDDADAWDEFSRLASDETDGMSTLRGMLAFRRDDVTPIPLEEVESAASIARRFVSGAMSFGSISAEAHETLAIAMNQLGARSNTGEGGEESERLQPGQPADRNRRSAIKQIASGRFGVHAEYLVQADELQIKMAQGAKPGEGGQLPGHKVSERIAAVRCSTPGVTLISPPPHHDIYSIEDLAQLIHDLKTINPRARISVKLVSEVGVGTVAAGVSKARAECIIIAGDAGGTGASPISSIKHAGVPWELGLAEAQQVLVANDLRGRVRLQVDGGLRTGRDVAVAALLGAEEFGFSTAPLVALGCIMLRKCHLNTCSVGIATQDPELVKRFTGEPIHVVRYFLFVAEELRRIMASLGIRRLDDLVGRTDLLRVRDDIDHWKARRVDLSAILAQPDVPPSIARTCITQQEHGLEDHLDHQLIAASDPALHTGRPVRLTLPISNAHRSVGAMLSGHVARARGRGGLPDDTIRVDFTGAAGQSFAAFLARGITFSLRGDANDYVGKGLSGGRVIVSPPAGARFAAHENIIIGNTVLYGATAGELFASGVAGERFAVRNSGASAVVEGVGDHGCEYMTGGVVIVLGTTGRNFAAGMSGGVAFVYDPDRQFGTRCNMEMVDHEQLVELADMDLVQRLVQRHVRYTASVRGQLILDNWDQAVGNFVKVMPKEYRRVLQQRRAAQRAAIQHDATAPAIGV